MQYFNVKLNISYIFKRLISDWMHPHSRRKYISVKLDFPYIRKKIHKCKIGLIKISEK